MDKIQIQRPDDWHVHFRDDEILKVVAPETSINFGRAIVMPNLIPPILTGQNAVDYKRRIDAVIPQHHKFKPLMTIYLTETTDKEDLKRSFISRDVFACKLYPSGATTNSESGVKNITRIMPILETMSEIGMPLLIHGEVTDKKIDIFDREKMFIDTTLDFICKEFPELKITLEHITTKDAILYIKNSNQNIAATITPHHLALNRNDLFSGGIRPHFFCLPILKREEHKQALLEVATSGDKRFFLGTDTAPHLKNDKENCCGCAGVFNAKYCLSILAQIFDNKNSINQLENFVSINGAKHYNLETNKEKITLIRDQNPLTFEKFLNVGNEEIKVFNPNFNIYWKVIS